MYTENEAMNERRILFDILYVLIVYSTREREREREGDGYMIRGATRRAAARRGRTRRGAAAAMALRGAKGVPRKGSRFSE